MHVRSFWVYTFKSKVTLWLVEGAAGIKMSVSYKIAIYITDFACSVIQAQFSLIYA